mmetsp:Transcript_30049/g.54062  ORF Transcript_30049/g.54062 Transcript_30049/m.54062 type:complete len:151 (+) Transcript_30049:1347-1799(+)
MKWQTCQEPTQSRLQILQTNTKSAARHGYGQWACNSLQEQENYSSGFCPRPLNSIQHTSHYTDTNISETACIIHLNCPQIRRVKDVVSHPKSVPTPPSSPRPRMQCSAECTLERCPWYGTSGNVAPLVYWPTGLWGWGLGDADKVHDDVL